MTEHTSESISTSSPELGFVLPGVSLQESREQLLDLARFSGGDTYEAALLGLDFINDFFSDDGIASDFWSLYVDASNVSFRMKQMRYIVGDIAESYDSLAKDIRDRHIEFVDGSVDEINTFLQENPGVIMGINRATGDSQTLSSVSVIHTVPDPGVSDIRYRDTYAQGVVRWGLEDAMLVTDDVREVRVNLGAIRV